MKTSLYVFTGIFIIVLVLFVPGLISTVYSQPPMLPPAPDPVPIDGGLGLLAAAGGAYAINKIRKNRKEA
ncbi:MAG: hypothetical protein LAT84_00885 [Balneolia bacterium]|nr:hypothetical protein [Balneolia bacterium]